MDDSYTQNIQQTGAIQVGNDTGTGTVSIGSSTGARQINIGTADNAQPQFVLSSAASGSLSSIKWVNGISCHNASVANDGQGGACTVAGTITPVKFETGNVPAGPADIGKRVYLSPVVGQEGKATLLQPSGSGERLFQVGILVRGVADASSNWFVQFVPQFIEDIP